MKQYQNQESGRVRLSFQPLGFQSEGTSIDRILPTYEDTRNVFVINGSRVLPVENTLSVLRGINEVIGGGLNVNQEQNYTLVDHLVNESFNHSRGQVNLHEMMARMVCIPKLHQEMADTRKVILLDEDLYAPGLEYTYGVQFPYTRDNRYAIISTARLADEVHANYVISHELGHLFGAPDRNRPDVFESRGYHCSDPSCIMTQDLSGRSSFEQAFEAYMKGFGYCNNCKEDIRRS